MTKFKLGDVVVGNKKASDNYSETVEGWKGHVVEVLPKGVIRVRDLEDGTVYCVDSRYFDLCKPNPKKKSKKFKVGDIVVGNKKANDYGITVEGWKGKIVSVVDVEDDQDDIWVKDLTSSERYWVRSERFDLLEQPEPKGYDSTEHIKETHKVASPKLKKLIEQEFSELFQPEAYDFGREITVSVLSTGLPIFIGRGIAPEGLEGRCLVVRNDYDLEVITNEDKDQYKILVFRKKK